MKNILHNYDTTLLLMAAMVALLLLFLSFLLFRYKKELIKRDALLEEKEEKIKYLRQVSAENEHRKTSIAHEAEKEILSLNHTIEKLETKIKEGTKNQVVSKLEAQQNKRAKALQQARLSS